MFHSFADNKKIHLDNIEQPFYYTGNKYHRTERRGNYIMNDNEKLQQFEKLWAQLSDEDREKIYAHLQALSSEPAASPAPHQ